MNIKVHFQGQDLWWLESGALAPINHCDDNGDVTCEAAVGTENSFAHVGEDGCIRRYREVIGTVDDLRIGWLD
jgi:hypothetical protein